MAKEPSSLVVTHKVVDKSPALDVAPDSYVDMLNDTSIDIDSPPLTDYNDYNDDIEKGLEVDEFGEVEDAGSDEKGELQEIEEGAFEGAVAKVKGRAIRTGNYTKFEEVILIKAWEAVSMDVVTGTDQTGKRYWKHIKDKFFNLMPPLASTPTRSNRSLQGHVIPSRWRARWAGCIEAARNSPPSGINAGDWDEIAQRRYKDMPGLKGKPFKFWHCYALLEHNEKWKLREQEAPPPRHKLVELEDAEEDDVLATKKNKKMLDGAKITKDNIKKQGETLEAKKEMMEKKNKEKGAKWNMLQEDATRNADVEERRAHAEKNRAMSKLIAAENATMMMDLAKMDEFHLEWWNHAKMEILTRRREAGRATIVGVAHGATILVVALAYISVSRHVKEETSAAVSSNMYASLDHVVGGMQAILAANHSAFVVADYLAATSNMNRLSRVEQNLFMVFAMQPHVAEMSYAGTDGSAFTYYRGKDSRSKKMFVSRRGKWYKQAVDPVTGSHVGPVAAVVPPKHMRNAAQALADTKSGSLVALGAGLARPSVQMVVFSAPVGDAGVVLASVPIKDVLPITDRAAVGFGTVEAYYSIIDTKHNTSTGYKALVVGSDAKKKKMEDQFLDIKCTTSAIDAPKLELNDVRIGSHQTEYTVACTSFELSRGVHLELRLVWQNEAMFLEIGVAVVSVVCLLAAMTAVACFFMARTLWRLGSREAALQGELMRQKEALQQAERKSMNKSNAFASAIHDIRSSLAAVAGLIVVSRTEARANPNLTYYLDQMEIGTNKLFDILNTILDMGKVESGKMQLEEVQFSMADVLEESMDMANVVGMSRGIEVVWDPCDFSVLRCDVVIGDCKRFKQILDNLLGNAIKFTHDGHVVLRAWANRPIGRNSMISTPSRFAPRWHASMFCRWLLGTREEGAEQNARRSLLQNDPNAIEFYFEVIDTGVGIPKEKRESMFENYVQVNEGHGGTGLGLGIVQSIVRLMGGEISIKDKEPGEAGTCFRLNVFLKISDAEEPIEHGRAVPSLFKEPGCFKGGQCVLLVHGDETRRILQTWMENVGMKVWPVPRAELLAHTMEMARAAVGASPSRPASISSSQGVSDDLDGVADRCFSSKEMVTQVLRNSSGNHAGHLHPFGLLVVVDVSGGRLNEILQEASSLASIKNQVPCRVACITDLKTSSEDLRRLKEAASCDMDLRKPIHGSRLRKLLEVMRELQASPFPQLHSHQVGIAINEVPAADQAIAASSEITAAATAASSETISETTSAAAVPQELPKLEDAKPLEGKRVLLVEDTRVLQLIQKKMLSTLGATVVVAADGSEAVAIFINALEIASGGAASEERLVLPYDVIFMDCQMPMMDGYEATKRIREEEIRYGIHTPIIALTAHSVEEELQKTIQAGMDLHLTKPIQKEKLMEAVHRVWKEDN
ncbi:probable histidine kinase 2 [Lolium rigidum]|uniref:probable histidine kinase 2 n=1 Tax=Lolium rigidum TaxID=89674 RepID=UPI001F5D4D37|nr:probable histidine kinase 2 [Lolium rigidum]